MSLLQLPYRPLISDSIRRNCVRHQLDYCESSSAWKIIAIPRPWNYWHVTQILPSDKCLSDCRRLRTRRPAAGTTWAEAAPCREVDRFWGRTARRLRALGVQARPRRSPRLSPHQVYECPRFPLLPVSMCVCHRARALYIDTRISLSRPSSTCLIRLGLQ